MISIEPFNATRDVWRKNKQGGMDCHEQRCLVLGITMEDATPVYIVEVVEDGESYLTTEETIKRLH